MFPIRSYNYRARRALYYLYMTLTCKLQQLHYYGGLNVTYQKFRDYELVHLLITVTVNNIYFNI